MGLLRQHLPRGRQISLSRRRPPGSRPSRPARIPVRMPVRQDFGDDVFPEAADSLDGIEKIVHHPVKKPPQDPGLFNFVRKTVLVFFFWCFLCAGVFLVLIHLRGKVVRAISSSVGSASAPISTHRSDHSTKKSLRSPDGFLERVDGGSLALPGRRVLHGSRHARNSCMAAASGRASEPPRRRAVSSSLWMRPATSRRG